MGSRRLRTAARRGRAQPAACRDFRRSLGPVRGRRRPVPHLPRRRAGEDRLHPLSRPLVPAARRDTHHPHLQAAAWHGRRIAARRPVRLGRERMAVRATAARAGPARRQHRDRGVRRPEGADRRTLRPRVDGRQEVDRAPTAGGLLPGLGLPARQEVREGWRPRHGGLPEGAGRQRRCADRSRGLSADAAGLLAPGRDRWACQELLDLSGAGGRVCDDAAIRRDLGVALCGGWGESVSVAECGAGDGGAGEECPLCAAHDPGQALAGAGR